MQKLKSKTLAILIAAILTISIGASTALIPNVSAHKPAWNIPTYAYINAAPNPIGIGQTLWFTCGLTPFTEQLADQLRLLQANGFHNQRGIASKQLQIPQLLAYNHIA